MASYLFVGAPFGAFFGALAAEIEARGGAAFRIVSHGGDYLDTPRKCRIPFHGALEAWPAFIEATVEARNIDVIITFNDTLPRHRIALDIAARLGLHSFVLENGYLRPFWVTLERDGVNGFSRLPRDPAVYLDPVYKDAEPQPHLVFKTGLRPHVMNAIRYFAAASAAAPLLGFDARTYGDSVLRQAWGYASEYLWRITHDESGSLKAISTCIAHGRRMFLCLMQKPGDGQLVVHSRHGGNEAFLNEVLTSFAAHSPKEAILVVKQHPLDYGIEHSPAFVSDMARKLGLDDRVFYLRKTSIDRILPQAFAVLTINSTAGLATIMDEKPVICLGKSFYDIKGLTFQGSVDDFWREAAPPSAALVRGFVAFLKTTSQINGGFHTSEGLAVLTPRLAQTLTQGMACQPFKNLSYVERHATRTLENAIMTAPLS